MTDFKIFDLKGMFDPQEPKHSGSGGGGLGNGSNSNGVVQALTDPKGYMENYQLGQISKQIAGMKTDKIRPDLQNLAHDAINKLKEDNFDLYKGNKNFGKFQLDSKQMMDLDGKVRNTESDINMLNTFTGDYDKIMTQAHADVGQGRIDPKELQAFDDKVNEIIKGNKEKGIEPAKSAGDLPHLQLLYNQMVHPKVNEKERVELNDKITEAQKRLVEFVGGGSKGQNKVDEEKLIKMLPYVSDEQLSSAHLPGETRQQKVDALHQMVLSGMPLKSENSLGWANFNFRVGQALEKSENGKVEIESEPGVNKTAKGGTLMKDGTNRWPISAYNMPYTGEAYEIDQETGKPTGKIETIKGATRSELVQDYKNGKKYTVVTTKEKKKDEDGNETSEYTDKQYIVYNADDTNAKLEKSKIKLKGWGEDFGKSKTESGNSISLQDARSANPNFKGTDAELKAKYAKHGYTVK